VELQVSNINLSLLLFGAKLIEKLSKNTNYISDVDNGTDAPELERSQLI
jgi:hypothetical protein